MKRLAVCPVRDLPPGQVKTVWHQEREIAIYNVGGRFHAMDNTCPHRGAPLSEGRLEGTSVTCPWHGWTFDVTNGRLGSSPESCLNTYPVEAEGGKIYLLLGDNQ